MRGEHLDRYQTSATRSKCQKNVERMGRMCHIWAIIASKGAYTVRWLRFLFPGAAPCARQACQ